MKPMVEFRWTKDNTAKVALKKAPDSASGVEWPKPAKKLALMDAASILKHKRALKAAQMRRYRAKKAGK